MVTNEMIRRAAQALCYESEGTVMARFASEGHTPEIAFLAVQAGKVYGR